MPEVTSNQWDRIKGLFAAARELPPAERSLFVLRACDGDTSLFAEVQRLLGENDQAGDFLESGSDNAALGALFDLHTFAPGDLISGRFKIVRFIGKGGMGEVYEAEDLELGEPVALKTIRPEIAADERVIARFKQEIQLSRRVTHANVCRVFDIERHKLAPGSQEPGEEVTYLTMELLPGETLTERLRRRGRMTTGEALPIVSQIIEGLQAAHRAGIVHGDLKSSNVILIPSDSDAVRAVVTDFGLARLSSVSGSETAGPTGGTGTPAYMAPEQVARGTITAAADIYSLGIVMFETVTGTLPFLADTPTLIANKRLEEHAPSPRTVVSDLDRRWERAILRCLERDPEARFATAADVARFLGHRSRLRVRAPSPRSVLMAVAAFLLVALCSLGIRAYLVSRPQYKVQLAQAQLREGLAYEQNAESKQAEDAFEGARRLYAAAGDRAGMIEALIATAELLRLRGDLAEAKKGYESALTISREIGAQQSVATALSGIGKVSRGQGELTIARSSDESALSIFRKINDKHGQADVWRDLGLITSDEVESQHDYMEALAIYDEAADEVGRAVALDDIGNSLSAQGNLSGARKMFEDEVSIRRKIGINDAVAFAMGNLGDILYSQGNLSEASRYFVESYETFRREGSRWQPVALLRKGQICYQSDQLLGARKAFEETLTLAYEFGRKGDAGEALDWLAQLSLAENRPPEAERQARQAGDQFRLLKDSQSEAHALSVLVQALVAEGKLREAQDTVQTGIIPEIKVVSFNGFRVPAMIAVGVVLAATGNGARGRKYLNTALDDASRLGYLGYQFEARLGLGEIAMKSGHTAEARAQLASLSKEAQTKGYALIAREAREAAKARK